MNNILFEHCCKIRHSYFSCVNLHVMVVSPLKLRSGCCVSCVSMYGVELFHPPLYSCELVYIVQCNSKQSITHSDVSCYKGKYNDQTLCQSDRHYVMYM